jgi:hypothetical protein
MGLTGANCRIFGQPEPGRPLMWGSAAWAQTQLTPGVSTLAAPRSSIKPPSRGVEGQSRGAGQRNGERKRMTGGRAAQETAKLVAGGRWFVCRIVVARHGAVDGGARDAGCDELHAHSGGKIGRRRVRAL